MLQMWKDRINRCGHKMETSVLGLCILGSILRDKYWKYEGVIQKPHLLARVNKMMTAVELFSGIGGFRIACDNLGISTVWANDHDALASGVYRKRFGKENYLS